MFAKALHSLAKVGEDLYLEPRVEGLSMRTMNSARSAFLTYSFCSSFFDEFVPPPEELLKEVAVPSSMGSEGSQAELEDLYKCRVAMRGVIVPFKAVPQLEKHVETCTFTVLEKDFKVRIQHQCRFLITKTYILPFIDTDTLKPTYDAENLTNRFVAKPRVLMDACLNFLSNQEEVTMSVSENQFLMKNYVESDYFVQSVGGGVKPERVVRNEISMSAAEFEYFEMNEDTTITFCLKELRSIIQLAETIAEPLTASFQVSGDPIVFTVGSVGPNSLEGRLVMATMTQDPVNEDVRRRRLQQQRTKANDSRFNASNLNESQQLSEASEPVTKRRLSEAAAARRASGMHPLQRPRPAPAASVASAATVRKGVGNTQEMDTLINPATSQASSFSESIRRIPETIPADIDEDAGFDQIVSDRELVSGGNRRTSLKRKQGMEVEGVGGNGDVTSTEQVPSSPPTRQLPGIDCSAPSAKRAKHIFKRCFEATFDPSSIPGTEKVLAPDSDEDEGETRSFDAIYARKRNNKR